MQEENDRIYFGEHNVSASSLKPSRGLESFPWNKYFALVGLEGEFPAILYEQNEADDLYIAMSDTLVELTTDPAARYSLKIEFADEPLPPDADPSSYPKIPESPAGTHPVGTMEIQLELPEIDERLLEGVRLSSEDLYALVLEALAHSHATEESYGEQITLSQIGEGRYRLA